MSNKEKDIGGIPEGYFDNFSNRLKDNLDQMDDQIATNAPLLSSIGKKEGYLLPEDYLNNFKPKVTTKRLIPMMSWVSGIAACMILVIACVVFMPNNSSIEESFLASVDDDELINYLMENASEFETEDLYEISHVNNEPLNEIDLEQLDYLMDNVSDIELYEFEDL